MLSSYTTRGRMDKLHGMPPPESDPRFSSDGMPPPQMPRKNSEHDPVARVSQVDHHHPGGLSVAGEGRGDGREGERELELQGGRLDRLARGRGNDVGEHDSTYAGGREI